MVLKCGFWIAKIVWRMRGRWLWTSMKYLWSNLDRSMPLMSDFICLY